MTQPTPTRRRSASIRSVFAALCLFALPGQAFANKGSGCGCGSSSPRDTHWDPADSGDTGIYGPRTVPQDPPPEDTGQDDSGQDDSGQDDSGQDDSGQDDSGQDDAGRARGQARARRGVVPGQRRRGKAAPPYAKAVILAGLVGLVVISRRRQAGSDELADAE